MRESATYQMIRDEGRVEGRIEGREEGRAEGELREARRMLDRLGAKRIGPMSAEIRARIESINDLDRLEELADRLMAVSSWEELLGAD